MSEKLENNGKRTIVSIVEGGNNKYLLFLYNRGDSDRVIELLHNRFGYKPDNNSCYNGSPQEVMQNFKKILDGENIYYDAHKDANPAYIELEVHCTLTLSKLEKILLCG